MNFKELIERLYQCEEKKITGNGTVLVCHVPHVAPEAWLHKIYSPLSEGEILNLEKELQKPLPTDLIQFYTFANGINIFSDSLSIWGQRNSYEREGEAIYLPYDIISLNEENNGHSPEGWVYFGSYSWDGSQMVFDLTSDKKKVLRVSNCSTEILNEWSTFSEWLGSEIKRLATLFDSKGNEINPESPTTPK